MNPTAILTLISDLYTQISAQADRIRELEGQSSSGTEKLEK